MSIDSENYLFKLIDNQLIPNLIERNQLNKRRKKLYLIFKNIKDQFYDCVLLVYRGYLSDSIQLDLFQTVNITLETPKNSESKNYNSQPYIFRKSRKGIETLF